MTMPSVSAIASLSLVIFLFQPSLGDTNRREKRAVFDIIPKHRNLFLEIPNNLNVLWKHTSWDKEKRLTRNQNAIKRKESRESIEKLKHIFERWKDKNQSFRINSANIIDSRRQATLTILFCLVLLLHASLTS